MLYGTQVQITITNITRNCYHWHLIMKHISAWQTLIFMQLTGDYLSVETSSKITDLRWTVKQLLPQVCRICLLCIDFLKAILSFLLKICFTTIIYAIVQKAEYEKQKLLDGSDEQIPFDPILHHSNMCKLATVLS